MRASPFIHSQNLCPVGPTLTNGGAPWWASAVDNDGRNAAHCAAGANNIAGLLALVDASLAVFTAPDATSTSVVTARNAARSGATTSVDSTAAAAAAVGAFWSARDALGFTPLHCAALADACAATALLLTLPMHLTAAEAAAEASNAQHGSKFSSSSSAAARLAIAAVAAGSSSSSSSTSTSSASTWVPEAALDGLHRTPLDLASDCQHYRVCALLRHWRRGPAASPSPAATTTAAADLQLQLLSGASATSWGLFALPPCDLRAVPTATSTSDGGGASYDLAPVPTSISFTGGSPPQQQPSSVVKLQLTTMISARGGAALRPRRGVELSWISGHDRLALLLSPPSHAAAAHNATADSAFTSAAAAAACHSDNAYNSSSAPISSANGTQGAAAADASDASVVNATGPRAADVLAETQWYRRMLRTCCSSSINGNRSSTSTSVTQLPNVPPHGNFNIEWAAVPSAGGSVTAALLLSSSAAAAQLAASAAIEGGSSNGSAAPHSADGASASTMNAAPSTLCGSISVSSCSSSGSGGGKTVGAEAAETTSTWECGGERRLRCFVPLRPLQLLHVGTATPLMSLPACTQVEVEDAPSDGASQGEVEDAVSLARPAIACCCGVAYRVVEAE